MWSTGKQLSLSLLLLLCALVVSPTLAVAQDDEIFVDPDSPAGKEYALPIDRARQDNAAQARSPRSASERAAPLFGEGVRSEETAAPPPRQAGVASAAGPAQRALAPAANDGAARVDRTARAATEPITTPGGPGGLITIAGAGMGVVLLGALGGLWLRRRSAG